jgi:uncharacterized phiE125 gp8 family phage protein
MKVVRYSAPAVEPVSVADAKMHLVLEADTMAGNVTTSQSIGPGSHGISGGGLYTHKGAGVSVLGKEAIVNLNAGAVGTGGTVDAKIQESDVDSDASYTDWTGGAFTQVTAANDNAIQEIAYTGTKAYVRVVAKVLVAACSFGANVVTSAATLANQALLTALITASREYAEDVTSRKLITQAWDYFLDDWPDRNFIRLPFGNLQNDEATAPVVTWKDVDGTETTLTVNTDYIVETNGEGCGRIVLPDGVSWPTDTLYPSNPIKVRFTCGYGTAATDVPEVIRAAIKLILADLWEQRGDPVIGQTVAENKAAQRLLASYRIPWEF